MLTCLPARVLPVFLLYPIGYVMFCCGVQMHAAISCKCVEHYRSEEAEDDLQLLANDAALIILHLTLDFCRVFAVSKRLAEFVLIFAFIKFSRGCECVFYLLHLLPIHITHPL